MFDGVLESEKDSSLETIPDIEKVSQKMIFLNSPSNFNPIFRFQIFTESFPFVFDPGTSKKKNSLQTSDPHVSRKLTIPERSKIFRKYKLINSKLFFCREGNRIKRIA